MVTGRTIDERIGEISSLEELREELYGNTLKVLALLSRRLSLSERIREEKEKLSMPVRDRDRELEVIQKIPGINDLETSVLNMIFELTTLRQLSKKPTLNLPDSTEDNEALKINGDDHLLAYCAGLMISYPGFELNCGGRYNDNLSLGVIQRGGHVTAIGDNTECRWFSLVEPNGKIALSLSQGTLILSSEILQGEFSAKSLSIVVATPQEIGGE